MLQVNSPKSLAAIETALVQTAEIRFANFVPCRIMAFEREGSVTLEALTPAEICGLRGRAPRKAW